MAAGAPAPVPTSMDPVTLEEKRKRLPDGPLRPPIKLRGLNPAYPEALRATGTQGSVILDALVAANAIDRDTERPDTRRPRPADAHSAGVGESRGGRGATVVLSAHYAARRAGRHTHEG